MSRTKTSSQTGSHHVVIAARHGLTSKEVEASRAKHGDNLLTPPPRDPWWKLFLEKFDDPVIRILLVAAFISLAAGVAGGGHYVEAVGILAAVFLATFLAFINEFKAGAEFDILNKVNDDIPVKVVRDGVFATAPRRDLVVGDLVLVEAGDEICADGDIIEGVSLQVDESRLTGESLPVNKRSEEEGDPGHGTYPAHHVLRSTLVADGHGAMLVTAVGDGTEIGRTARAAAEETGEVTPLNRQLDQLAKLIGVLGFSIAAITFVALNIRALIVGDLVLDAPQWWFLGAAAVGLAIAAQKVWVPVYFDARELLGHDVEAPDWLEQGGIRSLLRTTGAGIILFAVALGLLIATGAIASAPGEWVDVEVANQLLTYFMIAVVIVVVAVPEGLAMSVTLSLAYSMRKMTASNNLVRRMHACETIGAATCICSDKTGTLTENRMRVHQLAPGEGGDDAPWSKNGVLGELLLTGIAANSTANLSFEKEDGEEVTKVIGNPTEGALLLWLNDESIDYLPLRDGFDVEKQWAFHTKRKFMATLGGEQRNLHVKGAPEIVLDRCIHVMRNDGTRAPLEPLKDGLLEQLRALQARGMRTLGLAFRPFRETVVPEAAEDAANELTWLGFFAIADPVRGDVAGAIGAARRAGIDVKIVTGDNAATAAEIGRQITLEGLDRDGAVMTGPEFADASDEDARAALADLRVLARARPADKMRLVQLLQEEGHVVAVTGDGTNDAPALNYANVGLAMGKSGTSIAKEAADIVLLDDSFSSIINAVKWGRSLYRNIQRFILFQLTINVAACIIAMLGPFIGVELPLTVMQMLWVNLIMDTFAALALATEPPQDEVLSEPPRKSDAFIINRAMARNILGVGFFFVVLLIAVLKLNLFGGSSEVHQLTLFFNFFVFLQFWNLFNARTLGSSRSGLKDLASNPLFLAIAGAIVVGQVVIIQFGGEVFRTTPLSLGEWALTVGVALPVLIVGEAWRAKNRAAAA